MNMFGMCMLHLIFLMSMTLDSSGMKSPTCLPNRLSWREKNDPAVCSDKNSPSREPNFSINGIKIGRNMTRSLGRGTIMYQPSKSDSGKILVCSVSEDLTCLFNLSEVFYKPNVAITRISQGEFLCEVDANPLTTIVWKTFPNYMIHYTNKGTKKKLSSRSVLHVMNSSMITDSTTFTCSMENDMGSDNSAELLYRQETTIGYIGTEDSKSNTLNEQFNSLYYTTAPWKVGKSENASGNSLPLFIILVIVASILCLLILLLLGIYVAKRTNHNNEEKNNDNNEPIYAELNIISENQTNTPTDTFNSVSEPVPPAIINHYEDLPGNPKSIKTDNNEDKTSSTDISIDPDDQIDNSENLESVVDDCLEQPSYFVLEQENEETCTIYEDIIDKHHTESTDIEHVHNEETSLTEDENNIYAEIGMGYPGKDFENHENEFYESLDNTTDIIQD